ARVPPCPDPETRTGRAGELVRARRQGCHQRAEGAGWRGRTPLMSRIVETFDRLRRESRGGLVTYVTAGDPDATVSARILVSLAQGGADILEVGVPFSDPLADGPVIQRATER